MILAHRLHAPELAAQVNTQPLDRPALERENAALRARVAELEAMLASSTEPATPRRRG